jgi:hypothetical protein
MAHRSKKIDAAKCDAIQCPRDYPLGKKGAAKLIARNVEFGPLLGVAIVHSSQLLGGLDFVRADPHVEPGYPAGHDQEHEPQFTWEDRGDGVLLGTLIPDETEAEPEAEPKHHA